MSEKTSSNGPAQATVSTPANFTDPTQFTNYTWAALVLAMAGLPITVNNLNNFTTWMTAENASSTWTGTAGSNNPLNNGLGSGGGDGTGSYPDLATAALYAAKGIEGGIFSSNCGGSAPGGIAKALAADAPFPVFQQATIQSGWAGGCYSGSGYAGLTAAAAPPAVSVSSAGSHKSTHSPSIGDVSNAIFSAKDLGILGNVASSANTLSGGVIGDAANLVKNTASWTDELGKLLGDVTSASWWQRVGMGALGVFLFGVGLAGFVSTTKPGQAATSDAGEAVKSAGKDAALAAVVA